MGNKNYDNMIRLFNRMNYKGDLTFFVFSLPDVVTR